MGKTATSGIAGGYFKKNKNVDASVHYTWKMIIQNFNLNIISSNNFFQPITTHPCFPCLHYAPEKYTPLLEGIANEDVKLKAYLV